MTLEMETKIGKSRKNLLGASACEMLSSPSHMRKGVRVLKSGYTDYVFYGYDLYETNSPLESNTYKIGTAYSYTYRYIVWS